MSTYEIQPITNRIYSIKEDITGGSFPIFIYLILGDNKAALIDTGLGTGNLRKAVEELTSLPVIVLHTHGHIDHTGADSLFSEVYLSPTEHGVSAHGYDRDGSVYERERFIRAHLFDSDARDSLLQNLIRGKADLKPLEDGDLFDLGGVTLEAVSTPGHTAGSISFVSPELQAAFTGDGIADIHWFDTEDSIGVEGFLVTLDYFDAQIRDSYQIFAAHIPKPLPYTLIQDLTNAARAILDGADDPIENADYQFLRHGELYAHHTGCASIYYKKENIISRD